MLGLHQDVPVLSHRCEFESQGLDCIAVSMQW